MVEEARAKGLVFDERLLEVYLGSGKPAVLNNSLTTMYRTLNVLSQTRMTVTRTGRRFTHGWRRPDPPPDPRKPSSRRGPHLLHRGHQVHRRPDLPPPQPGRVQPGPRLRRPRGEGRAAARGPDPASGHLHSTDAAARVHERPAAGGALAAILAALLLVGVGGTSAAAGVPTGAAVQHVQPGAGDDQGRRRPPRTTRSPPHAAKVGVPKRHGPHPGTTAATLDRSAPVTTAGTPADAQARRLAAPDPLARQLGRTRTTGLTGPSSRPPARRRSGGERRPRGDRPCLLPRPPLPRRAAQRRRLRSDAPAGRRCGAP